MSRRRFLGLMCIGVVMSSCFTLWGQTPEKTQIAFRTRRNGLSEIFLMDIDGKNLQNLTKGIAEDGDPTWSPDGKRIAFWSKRGNGGIYVMDADGKNIRLLTDHPEIAIGPAWSPDGQKIAFWARPPGIASDIYVMDADGGNVHPLTDNPASDTDPAWSPDGKQIAFRSTRAGGGIYVMDADGGNVRRLTFFEEDQLPAWSPDSKRIAFTSLRDANPEIYVMNADGRNQQRLTHNRAPDSDPAWFDPRLAHAVASMSRKATIWGWLKQLSR